MIFIQDGIDHIPIHHENEIAQSKGYSGKLPANYWMHVNFMLVDGEKMSKSLGNVYTLQDVKDKGFEPLVLKMLMFTSNYRNQINFTWDAMEAAKVSLERLRDGFLKHKEGKDKADKIEIKEYEEKFLEAINDDLNMPVAMSVVWDVIKNSNKSKDFAKLLLKFDEVLGLNLKSYEKEEIKIPDEIKDLVHKRNEARKNKDWTESDRLRDLIISKGYEIKDTAEGTKVDLKG